MSTHDDAGHAHDFDGEPAQTLGPGEPQTPAYLPAIGLALFLVVAVAYLALASDGKSQAEAATPKSVQVDKPATREAQPAPAIASGSTSAAGLKNVTPEQRDQLMKALQERKKRGLPPPVQGTSRGGQPAPAEH